MILIYSFITSSTLAASQPQSSRGLIRTPAGGAQTQKQHPVDTVLFVVAHIIYENSGISACFLFHLCKYHSIY